MMMIATTSERDWNSAPRLVPKSVDWIAGRVVNRTFGTLPLPNPPRPSTDRSSMWESAMKRFGGGCCDDNHCSKPSIPSGQNGVPIANALRNCVAGIQHCPCCRDESSSSFGKQFDVVARKKKGGGWESSSSWCAVFDRLPHGTADPTAATASVARSVSWCQWCGAKKLLLLLMVLQR